MPSAPPRRVLTALVAATALVLTAAACSSGSGADTSQGAVVTSFYPLQFATQQITGGTVPVTVLTKPGAEPHDLELAPQDIATMTKARLVVYSDGFQPAVDEAMAEVQPSSVLDVADAARLTLTAAEEEGHAGESAAQHGAHDHSGNDPHFWLDPQRYADVAKAIGARLAEDDPAHAAAYDRNTAAFVAKLTTLDGELRTGLASCRSKVLVTSHAAFGYLAQRYGLEQHGITGISPEAEPSAAGLQQIADLVRKEGVTTIFQETLVEAHFAETVAGSTGAQVATLDPLEGITSSSAGTDYFEVMRSNLSALQKGLGCS
ncbi:zinc ABC transporter substrate-binding protein [Terrabacter aerolatus]|uniref:Zinc ABC transporter substrate-binding protein n=1 Tax=Terrabacter aerolatus TaxID=422442 RepID=A0A512D2Z7_9MICO|nr:metal ABC transporter substrate-binding protein [Terrabacter aerolatus]GEO30835.1 zinc ABC transporter substrate-binding protein [Terrabacter aerolatus]